MTINIALLDDQRCQVCPVCNCRTIDEGDRIDGTQVDPDHCEWCGYIQPGYWDDPDSSWMDKCWELQVDPWGTEQVTQ